MFTSNGLVSGNAGFRCIADVCNVVGISNLLYSRGCVFRIVVFVRTGDF